LGPRVFDAGNSAVLADGVFVSSHVSPSAAQAYFHVYDFTGDGPRAGQPAQHRVRSFGQVPSAQQLAWRAAGRRSISNAGGSTFWAGPPAGSDRGYEFELWRTDGTLLRVIRRDAPWFTTTTPARGLDGARIPPPQVLFSVDTSGLMYVAVGVPNGYRWGAVARAPSPEARDRAEDDAMDIYIDVIDTRASVLLASTGAMRFAQMDAEGFPRGLFPLTRLGYRSTETQEGYDAFRIVAYSLVAQ